MFRKVSVLLAALLVILSCAACGSNEQAANNELEEAAESLDGIDGGWSIADSEAATLPEEVQTAFDKALEKHTGSALKPVAYVANQVVAGMNHMILCEATTTTENPITSLQMVIIYADLGGNAELTTIKDFDLLSYTGGSNTEINSEQLSGGWSVPEDTAGTSISKEAQEAFNKASGTLTGSEMEPLALLGTQVVAGTNYAFICKTTLTTQEPVTAIQIVTVYADLQGNAEITNISMLDPADYNE